MENRSYKNKNTVRKYLNIMQNNQLLKVKNSLLELEKDFIDLKDVAVKEREIKIKRQREELFLNHLL